MVKETCLFSDRILSLSLASFSSHLHRSMYPMAQTHPNELMKRSVGMAPNSKISAFYSREFMKDFCTSYKPCPVRQNVVKCSWISKSDAMVIALFTHYLSPSSPVFVISYIFNRNSSFYCRLFLITFASSLPQSCLFLSVSSFPGKTVASFSFLQQKQNTELIVSCNVCAWRSLQSSVPWNMALCW